MRCTGLGTWRPSDCGDTPERRSANGWCASPPRHPADTSFCEADGLQEEEDPMKAIVIDDSKSMRMILKRIMGNLGYEVMEAEHGQDALDKLETAIDSLPDVALIDWNMPVMDGLSFVQRVRTDNRFRPITLMMVTSESEQSQIVRALAAGAHEYVIKPFTADAIADKLELLGLETVGNSRRG